MCTEAVVPPAMPATATIGDQSPGTATSEPNDEFGKHVLRLDAGTPRSQSPPHTRAGAAFRDQHGECGCNGD